MDLSRGAQRLLTELNRYARSFDRVFPFQKTLAATLEVDVRTIKRWSKELSDAGAISSKRRAHGHGIEYSIKQVEVTKNVPSSVPSSVPSTRPFIMSYVSTPEKKTIARASIRRRPRLEELGGDVGLEVFYGYRTREAK